jgi:uncharacterized protein (DUF305 family)
MATDSNSRATGNPESSSPDEVLVLPWWRNPANIAIGSFAVALLVFALGFTFGARPNGDGHNTSDVGFLQDMRIHHEQALTMSLIYVQTQPESSVLRSIAYEIIMSQGTEIGRMVQLLRDFDEAETNETDQAMTWMGDPTPLEEMPGLASDEQMKQLQQSRGAAADDLFARLMIAHHKGGVHMAEHAAMHGTNDEVRLMAESMVKAQTGEIADLEKQLAE